MGDDIYSYALSTFVLLRACGVSLPRPPYIVDAIDAAYNQASPSDDDYDDVR